ncbi:MAG: hypothetical protein AB1540_10430 [Bdellovibrionota bacterium]
MKKLLAILIPCLVSTAAVGEVKRKTASTTEAFATSECAKFITHNEENTQISGKPVAVRMEQLHDYASKKDVDGIVLYFEQVRKESNFTEKTGLSKCQALPVVYFKNAIEKSIFYNAAAHALNGDLIIRVKTNVSDGSIGGRSYSLIPNTVELVRE